ncbi:MAG: hypothetical protein GY759_14765 [Chloroflexi bacterium]|nr:hypothetical protein [Chloroflexota bacterium]
MLDDELGDDAPNARDLAMIAEQGGAFDFLSSGDEVYSDADLKIHYERSDREER